MGDVWALLLVAAVSVGLTLWLTSRATGLSVRHLIRSIVGLGHRQGPLVPSTVNSVYRGLMREAGIRGPSGAVRLPSVTVVRTPPADYAYIREFGEEAFERQLMDHVADLAERLAWEHDPAEQRSIILVRDPQLPTLQPRIAAPGASSGGTALLESHAHAAPAAPVRPAPGPTGTRIFDSDAMQATGAMATLVIDETSIALDPSLPKTTVGSGESCTVRVIHDHVSSVQFFLEARGPYWVIGPMWDPKKMANKNLTKVNGVGLRRETVLSDGDQIRVGDFGPIVFRAL